MVTYLPTILMNMINQATNYITGDTKYDLIYTINITCMMVLASVYLSVSASLPSTANIKPVEWWLLFNLTWPFLIIVTNIIIQVTGNRKYICEILTIFFRLEALERESCEDNIEGKRKVQKRITVEPLDQENIFIRKQLERKYYIKQILSYSVKLFYPGFYVIFLTGYFLFYLIL